MMNAVKPISIKADSELAKLLTQAKQEPVVVENNGERYQITSLDEEEQFEQFLTSKAFTSEVKRLEQALVDDPSQFIKVE